MPVLITICVEQKTAPDTPAACSGDRRGLLVSGSGTQLNKQLSAMIFCNGQFCCLGLYYALLSSQ